MRLPTRTALLTRTALPTRTGLTIRTALTIFAVALTTACTSLGAASTAPTTDAADTAPPVSAPGAAATGAADTIETAEAGGAGSTPRTAAVAKVVDGDTIDVLLDGRRERVRLIGIDTPESVKPDSPIECYGVEASHHLAELLPEGTEVELVRDAELRDPYDRLLAYVFRRDDGLFVNLTMAAQGYANALTIAPNVTFAEDFRAAVAAARAAGSGLWASCADPDSLFDP